VRRKSYRAREDKGRAHNDRELRNLSFHVMDFLHAKGGQERVEKRGRAHNRKAKGHPLKAERSISGSEVHDRQKRGKASLWAARRGAKWGKLGIRPESEKPLSPNASISNPGWGGKKRRRKRGKSFTGESGCHKSSGNWRRCLKTHQCQGEFSFPMVQEGKGGAKQTRDTTRGPRKGRTKGKAEKEGKHR